jgi:hypothetical protein
MFFIFAACYNCSIHSANKGTCNGIDLDISFGKRLEHSTTKSSQGSTPLEYQYIFYRLALPFSR